MAWRACTEPGRRSACRSSRPLDDVRELAGALGVDDHVVDTPGHGQDLSDGDATDAVGAGDEPLGDDPLQRAGEHRPHLLVLARREEVEDPVDRLGRVEGVDRGQDEVSGLGRRERGADRDLVAHLADQDDVRDPGASPAAEPWRKMPCRCRPRADRSRTSCRGGGTRSGPRS